MTTAPKRSDVLIEKGRPSRRFAQWLERTTIDTNAAQKSRQTFSGSATTATVSVLYAYTGTGVQRTLTLTSDVLGSAATHFEFTIKDEGGDCAQFPLTIDPDIYTIDGSSSSLQISTDYGSLTLYGNGSEFFTL